MDSIDDVANSIPKYAPLHFAHSVGELMEKSELKSPAPVSSIKRCIESMRKLNVEALKAKTSRDQEMQFFFLYRYSTLASHIPKFKEYMKEKDKYSVDIKTARENSRTLQSLRDSLEIRYETAFKRLVVDLGSSRIPKTVSPPKEPLEVNRSELNNSNIQGKASLTTIDCFALYQLIKRKSSLLVLDTRSNRDFRESHLTWANIINIPEEVITKGDSASMIGKKLCKEDRPVWDKRGVFDRIVLLDWYSKEPSIKCEAVVSIVRDAMVEWDPGTEYKNPPSILDGGFEEFLNRYPHMTTNPSATPPPPNNSTVNILDSLDYPMIDLEVAKENVVPPLNAENQPISVIRFQVDRSTKPKKRPEVVSVMEVEPNLIIKDPVEPAVVPPMEPPQAKKIEQPKKPTETVAPVEEVPSKRVAAENPPSEEDDSNLGKVGAPQPETNQKMLEMLRKVKPDKLIPSSPTPTTNKEQPSDESVYFTSLKSDGKSPGSNLKRSSSSPNINQLKDDDIPMKQPSFTRSNKPRPQLTYGEKMDATYGSTALGLTGLKNFANNCYMNSILQCLSNTEALVKELINLNKPALNYQSKTKGMVALEVIQTLRSMWSGDIRVYSIKDLKALMGNMKDIFKGTSHQDSNEFLIILLEYLHEDLNVHNSLTSLSGAEESTGEKAWGEFRRKNSSVIQRLFYGQQKSTVTCSTCQHSSVTFEPFFNLFVPIPSTSDKVTLHDCIQLYMSGENITGWKCPKCHGERNATKKFDISKLPPVLIIALKRFTQENDSWLHKKENVVMYPVQDLDMRRFTVRDSEQRYTNYDLYAVSTHSGTLKSGHYKAICKNYLTRKWYMFDDQFIDPLPLNAVRNHPDAYILFYSAVNN